MRQKKYKILGIIGGVLLGLASPAGGILFRILTSETVGTNWVLEEIKGHEFYYKYMALATPIFFAVFGLWLGHLLDRIFQKNESLESANTLLKHQSMTDDLTGIYNRHHILSELDREIERARRYHHGLSGLMIDIDNFKIINDKYGHVAGDFVLREVAHFLTQGLRRIDILGRYGGDEFFVILPEASIETSKIVAERMLKNISEHSFRLKLMNLPVTVSIGITTFGTVDNVDRTVLVEKADTALMAAKKAGKNRVSP
jgi:diguanylate cyclase (GGDEF)-like protein